MQKKSLTRIASSLWIINILIVLGVAAIYWYSHAESGSAASLATYTPVSIRAVPQIVTVPTLTATPLPSRTRTPAATAAAPTASATPTATKTPVLYLRPTDTRWPTVTRTPSASTSPSKRRVDPGDLMPSPTPTNVSIIGYSVARRPLEIYRFGSGPTARLIIAGIHGGNEWNTVALAHELIDYVVAHPTMIPKNITLYIMPNLNPDGEARIHGLDGRVNDHGVDLNRNWPWNWKDDWPRAGCWDYRPVTGGDRALSEPETRSLYTFIMKHPEIDALISYHAAKLGIFAGGVPNYGPSISLANTADAVSSYDYPPIDTHCTMTGDLTDWAATQHIAAIDIELDNFRYTDFEDNLAILKAFLKWHR